jgi:hypothetical protein
MKIASMMQAERVPELDLADGVVHGEGEEFGVVAVREEVVLTLARGSLKTRFGTRVEARLIHEVDRAGLAVLRELVRPVEPARELGHHRRPGLAEVVELGQTSGPPPC